MRTRVGQEWMRAAAFCATFGLIAAHNATAAIRNNGVASIAEGERANSLPSTPTSDTLSITLVSPPQRGLNNDSAAGDCRQSRDILRKVLGCSTLLERDPSNSVAHFRRAEAYQELEHHDAAIADFAAAIRLDPGYAAAYLGRGRSRQERGDLAGAIGDFTAALQLNPVLARAYVGRGAALELSGRLPEAVSDYNAALALEAGYEEAKAALIRLGPAAAPR